MRLRGGGEEAGAGRREGQRWDCGRRREPGRVWKSEAQVEEGFGGIVCEQRGIKLVMRR